MKKTLSLVVGLLLCSGPLQALEIFACEPEWAALARVVAGPDARITVATDPSQDPHRIEARPTLISAVRRADLVACTGAGLEVGWLPMLLARGANPDVQRAPGLFLAADHIPLLDKPQTLDRAEGDLHAQGNPHLHLDPRHMPRLAQALARQLAAVQPGEEQRFVENAERFTAAWPGKVAEWESLAAPLRGNRVVVHHRSWAYLINWLGLQQVGELEPRPGLPPSPGHLASLVEKLGSAARVPILYTSYNGDRAARWLADRTTSCAVELPHSPADDGEAGLRAFYSRLVQRLVQAAETCDGS